MDREKLKEQLKKMPVEELSKPILMRLDGDERANVVTGGELLDMLEGKTPSFGKPSQNPGGIISKDMLLNKLNKVLK